MTLYELYERFRTVSPFTDATFDEFTRYVSSAEEDDTRFRDIGYTEDEFVFLLDTIEWPDLG